MKVILKKHKEVIIGLTLCLVFLAISKSARRTLTYVSVQTTIDAIRGKNHLKDLAKPNSGKWVLPKDVYDINILFQKLSIKNYQLASRFPSLIHQRLVESLYPILPSKQSKIKILINKDLSDCSIIYQGKEVKVVSCN